MNIYRSLFNHVNFAIFVLIIWDAFKHYLGLWNPVYQLIILFPTIFIGVSRLLKKKIFWKIIKSKPISIWGWWIIYSIFNTFIITGFYPPNNQNPLVFISAILIVFIFLILIVISKSNTLSLIKVMQIALAFRLLLSFIFDSSSIQGTDIVARFGTQFNSNSIGFGALFFIVLSFIKKIQFNKISLFDYVFGGLSLITIFMTGSKKNFISLVFLLVAFVIIKRSKKIFKNFVVGALLFLVFSIGFNYVLNNTAVGERLIHSFEKTKEAEKTEQMFDHRALYYIDGWAIFKKHPINGIGLMNFANKNRSSHVLHTEYMVQLTEGGIIGSLLFLLFYWDVIKKLIKRRKTNSYSKQVSEIYLASIVVMFILFFGAWIYNNPIMWVLIGLTIRYIYRAKIDLHNEGVYGK